MSQLQRLHEVLCLALRLNRVRLRFRTNALAIKSHNHKSNN